MARPGILLSWLLLAFSLAHRTQSALLNHCTMPKSAHEVCPSMGHRFPGDSKLYNDPECKRLGDGLCCCGRNTKSLSRYCCLDKMHPHSNEGCGRLAALKQRVQSGQVKGVMLIHSRKAGGTTLRTFLFDHASKLPSWNLGELKVTEGHCWTPAKIAELKAKGWIFITSFRDPLTRILSSYDYEGRWGGPREPRDGGEPARTYDNVISLSAFLDRVRQVNIGRQHATGRVSVAGVMFENDETWQCDRNCFVSWWGGCPRSPGEITYSLPSAIAALNMMDVAIDMEHAVSNADYTEAFYDALGIIGAKLGHDAPYLDEYQRVSRGRLPYNVTAVDYARLYQENALDLSLIAVARRMWSGCKSYGLANDTRRPGI